MKTSNKTKNRRKKFATEDTITINGRIYKCVSHAPIKDDEILIGSSVWQSFQHYYDSMVFLKTLDF